MLTKFNFWYVIFSWMSFNLRKRIGVDLVKFSERLEESLLFVHDTNNGLIVNKLVTTC